MATLFRWRPTLRGRGRRRDTDPGAPALRCFVFPPSHICPPASAFDLTVRRRSASHPACDVHRRRR
jgi:hypothetical protein